MHDNFEKRVQQKMEELDLVPSASVWERVKVEIQVEKKRRRSIFWFLFAGLLLAGGSWWGYNRLEVGEKKELTSEKVTKVTKSPTATSSSNSIVTSKQLSDTANTNAVSITDDKEKVDLQNGPVAKTPASNKEHDRVVRRAAIPLPGNSKNHPEAGIELVPKQDETPRNLLIDRSKKEPAKIISEKPSLVDHHVTDSSPFAKHTFSLIDSSDRIHIKKVETQSIAGDSVLKKKVAANNKGWKKQLTVGAGWSGYIEAIGPKYSPVYNSPLMSGVGSSGPYRPQETSAGFGFFVGFSLSKPLNQKWELSVGLQYAHYTTRTKVGDKRLADTTIYYAADSVTADHFFTNANKANYTNRFHVIEFPVTVSYQPLIKLPVHVVLGAAYGRLLATNALTFSNGSNIYYQNKDNYVRHMLAVSSSVQVKLFANKKFPVRIGPSIQYNLLKLRKEETGGKPHLAFAGVKAGINF